ncbi:MAG: RidA family protein [Chitinophagaceae bacterium]|nr:RidA family protein [Rubrivivax sp.]
MNVAPILPAPARVGGKYSPVVVHQGIAYVSGQLPRLNNELQFAGKAGREIDLPTAREAARLCAMQCLAALDKELGGLHRVVRLLKITGYVASAEGFTDQPLVIDAASEYFDEVLGLRGGHARAAIGVFELPRGASVEVELMSAVRE